jgi:hypothetical protein
VLRALPLEISLRYPCDPDCSSGNLHVARETMTLWDGLCMDSDTGVSTWLRASEAAVAEGFELATLQLIVANGKHYEALRCSTGEAAQRLLRQVDAQEVTYESVDERDIASEYGLSSCSAPAFSNMHRTKVQLAHPRLSRPRWFAIAPADAAHAAGDRRPRRARA